MTKRMTARLAGTTAAVLVALAGATAVEAAGFPYLYEAFDSGTVATDVGTATAELGFAPLPGGAGGGAITAGGGFVYLLQSNNIFKASADLSSIVQLNTFGGTPTDLAVNGNGLLYLGFDSGIVGTSTAELAFTPATSLSHIAADDDHVYWLQANSMWVADSDLSNAHVLNTYGGTPTDFAIDASTQLMYLVFDSGIVVTDLATSTGELGFYAQNGINSIIAGDGQVRWQEQNDIFGSDAFLNGAGFLWEDGGTPHDLAIMDVSEIIPVGGPSGPGPVPEPSTWALMIAGFGLAGATLRRRNALTA